MKAEVMTDNMELWAESMIERQSLEIDELRATIALLEHQLETAKPAIIYAIENPDVIQSNL